jgi:hypothetical protein
MSFSVIPLQSKTRDDPASIIGRNKSSFIRQIRAGTLGKQAPIAPDEG